MSRRESRVSMNVRQNDALLEFETFKKKFLLANKHITKLNSTLSVRIEELNAQISSLYVENLRLRASEIALAAQLKREREKSRKVMTEAEAATLNLTKHLSYLRQSFNITPSSPAPTSPPSPRARKRPANRNPVNPSSNSPQVPRLSRAPNVPGIGEEEEPLLSSSEHEADKPASPVQRKSSKSKPRLSASRLPLPARVTEPPSLLTLADAAPPSEPQQPRSSTRPRKPSRRQSGLLSLTDSLIVPRSPSPAFGSPIRMAAGLAAEEEEEAAAVNEQLTLEADMEVEVEVEIHPKKMRRKSKDREAEDKDKEKDKEREPGDVAHAHNPPPRERERERDRDRDRDRERGRERDRERDKKRAKGEDDDNGKGKPRLKDVTNSRAVLLPIDNTAYDQPDETAAATTRQFLGTSPSSSQPNSRSSSSPIPPSDGEGGGRERRTRKSVNYAEPKLNTKMRKPDPQPGAASLPTKKRSSAAAVLTTYRPLPEDAGDNDTEGARSSLESPLSLYVNGNAIDPALFPLPTSRPPSAAASSSAADSLLFSSPGSRPSVKRKKSKSQITLDDDGEDSEGVHADAEYGYGYGSGWVNVEGRRKGGGGGVRRSAADVSDDTRRHSMAV